MANINLDDATLRAAQATDRFPVKSANGETIEAVTAQAIADLASKPYAGKTLAILGDSLTSYSGTTSNGDQAELVPTSSGNYPGDSSRTGITSQNQMFWGKFIEEQGMTLLVNNSISGSGLIYNYSPSVSENYTFLRGADNIRRVNGLTLDNEHPDVILVHCGGNDFDCQEGTDGEPGCGLGTYNGTTAPPNIDTVPNTWREAYAVLLMRLQTLYPNSEIWTSTIHSAANQSGAGFGNFPYFNQRGVSIKQFNDAIIEISSIFGVKCIDFYQAGLYPSSGYIYKYDNIHPNLAGHDKLYQQMKGQMEAKVGIVFPTSVNNSTPPTTTYNVTYNGNGNTSGTTTDTNDYLSGSSVIVRNNGFIRSNYSFVEFNTQADGNGTGYSPADEFTITSNVTLYAIWREIVADTYNVTYNANGGAGSVVDGNNYNSGATVTVRASAFTRTGYTFENYNTAANGSGTDYSVNDTFTITSDVTLYAIWTEIPQGQFTVTYNANQGTGSMTDSNTYVPNATVTVLDNTFTREGYRFTTFNTALDGSGTAHAAGSTFTITDNITLYAIWVEVQPVEGQAITLNDTYTMQYSNFRNVAQLLNSAGEILSEFSPDGVTWRWIAQLEIESIASIFDPATPVTYLELAEIPNGITSLSGFVQNVSALTRLDIRTFVNQGGQNVTSITTMAYNAVNINFITMPLLTNVNGTASTFYGNTGFTSVAEGVVNADGTISSPAEGVFPSQLYRDNMGFVNI